MFSVLFPGQGSQFVGMSMEIYKKYDIVKELFNTVDTTLGYSLSKLILEGPSDQLNLTENTQPAIMVVGASIFKVLEKKYNNKMNSAKFFAGHSLGEYTALVCANSLKIETGAYLLHERGKAMQKATPVGSGAMMAILGMSYNDVLEEIKKIDNEGVCEVANDNCPGQIVVSGDKKKVLDLNRILKEKSKKSMMLTVSAPFHCSLMEKAATEMTDKINESDFQNPNLPIISNVTAKAEKDSNMIKNLLIQQITSKVRWKESVEYMIKNGINEFVEIGPGKVLSGLVKRIDKNVKVVNINSLEDIENNILE